MPRGGVNADTAALKLAVAQTMAEKPLVLACPWGLGNRARALVAAVHHLRGQHRELLVPWGPHPVFGPCQNRTVPYCAFDELFEPIDHLNVTIKPFEDERTMRSWVQGARATNELVHSCRDDPALKRMDPCARARLHGALLRPQPALRRAAEALVREHGLQRCVGLHIRGSDHGAKGGGARKREALRQSGFVDRITDAFEARILRELRGRGEKRCFFLATEDPSVQARFLRLFEKPRVRDRASLVIHRPVGGGMAGLTRSGVVAGHRATSTQDAVVDAYVLAHCGKIWGTSGSSFSQLAGRWLPRAKGTFELLPDGGADGRGCVRGGNHLD